MKHTPLEIQMEIVQKYLNKENMYNLANAYGVSVSTISNILKKHNIPARKFKKLNDTKYQQIIEMYRAGASSKIIAKQFGINPKMVCDILRKFNISANNIYHNKSLKRNYWKSIDSIDKAYFLGYLLTDGNVYKNKISLQISEEDSYILEVFKKYTANSNKLVKISSTKHKIRKKSLYTFRCSCQQWVDDLSKYGVVVNKTRITTMPMLSGDMMPHLIRGMIDGDGWITSSHTGQKAIGFCGTYECCKNLHDWLVKTLNIQPHKISKSKRCDMLYTVLWCKNDDILTIGNYIFENKQDCFLKRKYDKFIQIIHGNTEVNHDCNESDHRNA